jgi:putative ABC transport system permease protein
MKREKWIIFFTMLSIFITTVLSITIPIISENMKAYNEQNIKAINGGMLSISAGSFSKKFLTTLDELRAEGYKVTLKQDSTAYLKTSDSTKIYSKVILGDEELRDDEIILSASLGKAISVKAGDRITVIDKEFGSKEYIVKSIEGNPKGVSNDAAILGYGKVSQKPKNPNFAYIDGKDDGENLKHSLEKVEYTYTYSSLKDKADEVSNSTNMKIGILGMLTTMGYILSSVTIISTCIVLITRRKKDIAIMKLLSIKDRHIRKAFSLEMLIIIGIPIGLSLFLSIIVSSILLKLNYIDKVLSLDKEIFIALKGMFLNLIIFVLFYKVPLMLLKGIKALDIIRESYSDTGKIKRRIFLLLLLLIPVVMLVYSIYLKTIISLGTGLLLLLIILLFFIITSILIRIFSRMPFRSISFLYSFKNIKKNFLAFNLIALSLAITLLFILIATSFNKTIKTTLNTEFKEALPYNYMLLKADNEEVDSKLTREKGVEGVTKIYDEIWSINNKLTETKDIDLSGIKKADYGLKFKLLEGKDIDFSDKNQCLISSKFSKLNKLKIGDTLKIYSEGKEKDLKVIGIYDSDFLNTIMVLVPYSEESNNISYLINSKNTKWMKEIKDSPVVSVNSLSDAMAQRIDQFIILFKILSVMIILSALNFNINIAYVSFLEERKDENILMALGLGKNFIFKSYIVRQAVIIIVSSILAGGFYAVISKVFLQMMGVKSVHYSNQIVLVFLLDILLCIVTFLLPMVKTGGKVKSELLRGN